MGTTFRPVSYGPCSRTGVTCVASDFGGINLACMYVHTIYITDFELARINAVHASLGPQVTTRGCFYHLTKYMEKDPTFGTG